MTFHSSSSFGGIFGECQDGIFSKVGGKIPYLFKIAKNENQFQIARYAIVGLE
jgi:hypothetical protein